MSSEKNELEPSEDHIIAPPIFVVVAVAVAVAFAAVAKNQTMSAEFAGNSLT